MKRKLTWQSSLAASVIVSLLVLITIIGSPAPGYDQEKPSLRGGAIEAMTDISTEQPLQPHVRRAYEKLPLRFEANLGQFDAKAKFLCRGKNYNMFLSSTGATLKLRSGSKSEKREVLSMRIVGGNPDARAEGLEQLPSVSNYFIGRDPSQWRSDVPNYAMARFHDVYPGIDVLYRSLDQSVEYDFLLAPGADSSRIRLAFDAEGEVRIDDEGDLVIETSRGDLRHHKPVIYQEADGVREQIAGRYVMVGKQTVGFDVGEYDSTRALIIDPVLTYSTYLGGSGSDSPHGVAVDSSGNAYITGETDSTNFPLAGPLQGQNAGESDVFVTKLNAAGTAIIYSTYIGGNAFDTGYSIDVGAGGDAYILGITLSPYFPTTPGAFDQSLNGDYDVFVARLNANGNGLVYSTFLGGSSTEWAAGIEVAFGTAYVTGYTFSSDFPTTPGAYDRSFNSGPDPYSPPSDGFAVRLQPMGNGLVFSTLLGGSASDDVSDIAVDSSSNVYMVGRTWSSDFPTKNSFDGFLSGTNDGFVTKLNSVGSALVYSTYLGGNSHDSVYGVAVDGAGSAYVTGQTQSNNFPTTSGAFDTTLNGFDAFVTKLGPGGATLMYSTLLGGSNAEAGVSIAVDHAVTAYVVGSTLSTNFPLTPDALDKSSGTNVEAFIARIDSVGSSLLYSSYIGGNGFDLGADLALRNGNLYIVGRTDSSNFPITPGAADAQLVGIDGFVMRLGF